MKRAPFVSAWLLWALAILIMPIPYWSQYIGEGKEYPWTMWLWLVGAAVFALGVRSYQYFKQGK